MTKPIAQMSKRELIWAIEGYAESARRSFDEGRDPEQTLGRIKSMIEHYPAAAEVRDESLGRTSAEFGGVSLETLEEWLRYWKDEKGSSGRAEEMARQDPEKYGGRTRVDHIRMIEAEIAARR